MKQVYLVAHRCVGCEECLVACEKVHEDETRAFVEVVNGYYPFPLRCQHCQDAPCKAVCPTGAIKMSQTGAVIVDQKLCIGCGTCGVVCPFGVPHVSAKTGKVVKCDMCDDRVIQGLDPVCVVSCPKGALAFGEREDQNSKRRQQVALLAVSAL